MDMVTDALEIARQARPAAAGPAPAVASSAASAAHAGEYLTCRLGGEEYAIDILRVQEIRSYEPPTRIASAPPHVRGVVNLRGVIVPIVDLRLRLGCDSAVCNSSTVIVVLNLGQRVVGAVVDAVADVVAVAAGSVKPAPRLSGAGRHEHITGIATLESGGLQRMLIIVDIAGLVGMDSQS
ncbi:MAG: chemotaxis protein CheW [Rubrivivax sp.]|nr:chemotaxis protein CheW [Rubrivivax sp.]